MVLVVSVIFFLIGMSLATLGFGTAKGRRIGAWPIAKGTIVRGEVITVDTVFMGVVHYRYALQPVSAYRGTDHQMQGKLESPPCATRREAEAHLLRYPDGDRVDVRYDPARPTRSLLGPLPATTFAMRLGLSGLAMMALAAVGIFFR